MTEKILTIGEVSKKIGVGVETIRFYQRINLIEQPEKPLRGYRIYPETTIAHLFFIKHAKELGFSLAEIKILLVPGDGKSQQIKELAVQKLGKIKSKIVELDYMADSLEKLITHCDKEPLCNQNTAIELLS